MSRVDQQLHRQLADKLTTLRQQMDAIRTDQTFGASDVRTYRVFNQTSNIDITLTNVTSTTPQCVEVTLTPNTLASNPVIAYDFTFSVSSSTTGNFFERYDPLPPVGGVQKFRLYLMGNGTTFPSVTVAFTFWTISPATFSAVQVSP